MGANSSLPDGSPPGGRVPTFSRLSHAYTVSDNDITVREKKKKASKLATLRKKLIRARRHSRSMDYGKPLRELISSWSVREIKGLLMEYDALAALKELAIAANIARPSANSLKQDFSDLFDFKYCTDIDLVYRGACFPAHRALLSIRSPYFRMLLSKYPGHGAQIPVKLKTIGVDVALFATLLRYLYTDVLSMDEMRPEHQEILMKLATEFGVPNPLDQDLRTLLETGEYSDAVLVFSCGGNCNDPSSSIDSDVMCKSVHHEVRCHKAVLAARSSFFRNLLLRRAKSGDESSERTLQIPSKIVLDESVIPRRYARVLLNAIYQDSVDLSLILRGSTSTCSLSEVQAIAAGKGQMTLIDEAMEVYQIGQFLDFPVLSQGCEDIIIEGLTLENLVAILNWGLEPHGSLWVHRQALHFLREEFIQVVHSSVLYDLSKDYLVQALHSDFLQSGELEILNAVLKWGEHDLVRRLEEREPNLLSHTTHSISRKGVKKRDLNDDELRDILSDVLPLVRIDHVIPHNSDSLHGAMRRGLISSPPSHMIEDEDLSPQEISASWIRSKNNPMFTAPRLFTPYFEDAKAVLDDRLSQGQDSDAGRVRTIQMSSIPDTLYMVEDRHYPQSFASYNPPSCSTVDIIAGTIPVPDSTTLHRMLQREQELQNCQLTQRAYALPCCDRRAVNHQLQLRTVREFGLPDSTVEVLQNSQRYYQSDQNNMARAPSNSVHHCRPAPSNMPHPSQQSPSNTMHLSSRSGSTPSLHRYLISPTKRKSTPPLTRRHYHGNKKPVQCVSPSRPQNAASKESTVSPCSDGALSDVMPDIAMATSSLSQIHLQDEFELDIGDRSTHHGTTYI